MGDKGSLLTAIGGAGLAGVGLATGNPDLIKWGGLMVAGSAIRALAPSRQPAWPAYRDLAVIDPLAYLPTVYGRARLSARLAEFATSPAGAGNEHYWLWLVLPLCHGEILSIDELYFDSRLVLAADGTWLPPFDQFSGSVRYAKYVGAAAQTTGSVGKQIGNRQRLTLGGGADTDTYTLNYAGQITAAIRKDASAATVQAALVALSNVGPTDVVVSGAARGPYTVAFQNALYDTNGPYLVPGGQTGGLTVTVDSLTGGTLGPQAITGDSLAAVDPCWAADSDGVNRHALAGIAYLLLQLHYRSELFPSGIPQIEAVVRGRPLKDPRTGLTKYGTNAILAWRDYATNAIYGCAIPEADLLDGDASEGIWAEADHCDDSASQPDDSGTWPIYRAGTAGAGPTLDECVILKRVTGAGTVSCAAGAATFSASQAGLIKNGMDVLVGGTAYTISGFDGYTSCRLSGAPTFAASAFDLVPHLVPGDLVWIKNRLGQVPAINGQWSVLAIGPYAGGGSDGFAFQLDDGSGSPFPCHSGTNNTGTAQRITQAARFTAQGVVDCAQPHRLNLQNILAAARADMFSVGGVIRPYIRRVRAAELFELAQPNMDPASFVLTKPGAVDVPNRLRVSYTDPNRNWQRQTFAWPPIDATNPYLVADNNVLNERPIELVMCYDRHQAERIAMVLLEEARAGDSITVSAVEEALRLAVDDVVNVTHRTPGWGAMESNTKAVTSSAAGNPGVLYAPGHGLLNGQRARLQGHAGSTPAINGDWYVTLVDADHVSIPVTITIGGTGGTIAPAPQPCWLTGIGIRPMAEANPISLSAMRYVPTAYDDQMTPDAALAPATNLPDPWTLAAPANLVLATSPGDPRISCAWDASADTRTHHYEVEAKRTASGVPGVAPDGDYRSYSPDFATALHAWVTAVNEGDVWSVRVYAVSALGVRSAALELTGYVAHVARTPLLGTVGVSASAGLVTYSIPFGDRCDYVLVYTNEYADAGSHPPPLVPAYAVRVDRPASGTASLPIATQSLWYRTTTIVPINTADGSSGQAQTLGPTQAASSGDPPAHPPASLVIAATYTDGFDLTYSDQGDAFADEYARLWVDGAIVKNNIAMGVQAAAVRGLQPGTTHVLGIDHIRNGQINPATGPITIQGTTSTPPAPSVDSASQAETDTNYPNCDRFFTVRVSWATSNAPDSTYQVEIWSADVGGARLALLTSGQLPSTGYWDDQASGWYDDGVTTPTTLKRYDVVLRRIADGIEVAHRLEAGASYNLHTCNAA